MTKSPSPAVLAASAALRERMTRSIVTAEQLADAKPVAGHDITITDDAHPNMATLACECGYHANVVRSAVTLMTLEHTRRPTAYLNRANVVN